MAKKVLTNAYLLLNGVNLSSWVESITLNWTKKDVPVTAMGDGGEMHLAGLEDNKISITFWQDHASTSVGPTLDAMFQAGTAVAFKIADAGTVFSTTNPTYSGSALALDYTPVAGKVNDGQQAPVSLVVNGTITQGTT
jgi:hypothetical protein